VTELLAAFVVLCETSTAGAALREPVAEPMTADPRSSLVTCVKQHGWDMSDLLTTSARRCCLELPRRLLLLPLVRSNNHHTCKITSVIRSSAWEACSEQRRSEIKTCNSVHCTVWQSRHRNASQGPPIWGQIGGATKFYCVFTMIKRLQWCLHSTVLITTNHLVTNSNWVTFQV